MPILEASRLRALCTALLEKAGTPADVAETVSHSTVENCLYGHDSHGMALIPRFLGDIEIDKIVPHAMPAVLSRSGAAATLDGRRGFGQVTMIEAMKLAMAVARESGVSGVAVTNCNHVGILWTFARMAAEEGMITMIWCVSGPSGGGGLVAPYGGSGKALGANPIAVAIPAGEMKPFVLDISTSAVAGGQVVLHAQRKKPIPAGWVLDENGSPTTDPTKLFKDGDIRVVAGALLPFGGYKGFGLGLAAEVLGGILTGFGTSDNRSLIEGNGAFVQAVDVGRFVPLEEFGRKADALFRYVKSVPTAEGVEEILIPGEIEYRTRELRERDGIPVEEEVWSALLASAKKLGVSVAEGTSA